MAAVAPFIPLIAAGVAAAAGGTTAVLTNKAANRRARELRESQEKTEGQKRLLGEVVEGLSGPEGGLLENSPFIEQIQEGEVDQAFQSTGFEDLRGKLNFIQEQAAKRNQQLGGAQANSSGLNPFAI